jgi:hypothetical protein
VTVGEQLRLAIRAGKHAEIHEQLLVFLGNDAFIPAGKKALHLFRSLTDPLIREGGTDRAQGCNDVKQVVDGVYIPLYGSHRHAVALGQLSGADQLPVEQIQDNGYKAVDLHSG